MIIFCQKKYIFDIVFLPRKIDNPYRLFTFLPNFNSVPPRDPRDTAKASKMMIGKIQYLNPDKNGVCLCPICPKGNLIITNYRLLDSTIFIAPFHVSKTIYLPLYRKGRYIN
jgi:hypothetical protein